jgi:hypothetical protein
LCERNHGGASAFALLCSKGADGDEHGGVDSSGTKEESAQCFLDKFGVGSIEGFGFVGWRSMLCFRTVCRFVPGMWRVFRALGSST